MTNDAGETAQPPLPTAEFQILLSLLDGAGHGHGIKKDVAARTRGQVVMGPGTLYSAIKRMLERGMIAEIAGQSGNASADERRRYYAITDHGRDLAQAEALRMKKLVEEAAAKRLIPGFSPSEK